MISSFSFFLMILFDLMVFCSKCLISIQTIKFQAKKSIRLTSNWIFCRIFCKNIRISIILILSSKFFKRICGPEVFSVYDCSLFFILIWPDDIETSLPNWRISGIVYGYVNWDWTDVAFMWILLLNLGNYSMNELNMI